MFMSPLYACQSLLNSVKLYGNGNETSHRITESFELEGILVFFFMPTLHAALNSFLKYPEDIFSTEDTEICFVPCNDEHPQPFPIN